MTAAILQARRWIDASLGNKDKMAEPIADMSNTQCTVVMVTHDVDEAVLLSDKRVMMSNGPSATIGVVLSV